MSNLVKQYREFEKEVGELMFGGKKTEALKLIKKANELRDNFTKADWQELIDTETSIPAKIDWTRMINERFPETKEELQ